MPEVVLSRVVVSAAARGGGVPLCNLTCMSAQGLDPRLGGGRHLLPRSSLAKSSLCMQLHCRGLELHLLPRHFFFCHVQLEDVGR